jgi:hypothetical protein
MINCPQCAKQYEDNALYCNECCIDLVETKLDLSRIETNKKTLGCSSIIIHTTSFFIGLLGLGIVLYNRMFESGEELNLGIIIMSLTFILWGGAHIFNHRVALMSFSTLPLGLALFWIQDGVINFGRYGPIYLEKEPEAFVRTILFTIAISIIIAVWALRVKIIPEEIFNQPGTNGEYKSESKNISTEHLASIAKSSGYSDAEIESAISEGKSQANKEAKKIMDELAKEMNLTEEQREELEAPLRKKMDEL